MTGSTVLVVRVPRPIEDADACIEHIKRGLRDGILVLGADVKYSVETFPPLGAVEVVAGSAVPVVIGGSRPTPAGGGGGLVVGGRVVRSVPDSGTEPEPEREEAPAETPKQQPDAPDKPTPILRSPPVRRGAPRSHALPMSESEIVASYRQAAKPAAQITVLADLNVCSKERIEEILREAGEPLPKKHGRQKRTEG